MNKNDNIYNPWEDSKSFIQDIGDLGSFLGYLNNNEITTSSNSDYANLLRNSQDTNLDILKEFNDSSETHFEKLTILEELYEKYRYESLLSKEKNEELCQSIMDLIDILNKFEHNKIKIANLLHNTHISDNNTIKIKHDKKYEFIIMMKTILKQTQTDHNDFDYINFSSSIHPETVNQIQRKYEKMFIQTDSLICQFEENNKLNF